MSSAKRSRSSEGTSEEFDEEINLNVGGTLFTTSLATLTRFPNTMLGAMFSSRHELQKNAAGAYFIDRDGRHFHEILNFLRGPAAYDQNELPKRAKAELAKELDYYGLTELVVSELSDRVAEMPVKMLTHRGQEVTISRGMDGVWMVTDRSTTSPLWVCRICGWAQYGSINIQGINEPIGGFPQFSFGRDISEHQPKLPPQSYSYNYRGGVYTCTCNHPVLRA